jgi:hypothetical protein
MRVLALSLALSSCAVVALAWTASPHRPARGVAPIAVASAPTELDPADAAAERVEVARAVTPAPAVVYGTGDWSAPQPLAIEGPPDPFAAARAHFHAQVRVEELAREMPPELDPGEGPRALSPEYVAAVEESTRLYADFASIQAPLASEPLPQLDLWAKDETLARTYRGWSREDLMLEQWRIERAANAEAKRLLDDRLEHGPYEVTRRGAPAAVG